MMYRSIQDSPYQVSFTYDRSRPAFPHLRPPSAQKSRIPVRKTPDSTSKRSNRPFVSTKPSLFNQVQVQRQTIATPLNTTTTTASHSPEYDPQLGSLSKNRKRGRDDCPGDFDDERYGSLRRSTKSANNGESYSNASRWRLDGRDADHTMNDESDGDDSTMKESYFSDTQYRRNAGPLDGPDTNLYESDTRGGKRRLLDVVGSVVGAVWEFCKSQAPSIPLSLPNFRTASADEYFSTPFNCPPEMFINEKEGKFGSHEAPIMKLENDISTPYKSLFDQPIAKKNVSPNFSRPFIRHDYSGVPESKSFIPEKASLRLNSDTDVDTNMSASWIMISPEASINPYASPSPSASTASMRRQSPQRALSPSIRPDTPTISPLSASNRRAQTVYARTVPTKRSRMLGRPVFTTSSSRNLSYTKQSFTSPSAPVSPSYTPPESPEPWTPRHSRRETISTLPSTAHLNSADKNPSGLSLKRANTTRRRVDEDDEDESMKRFTANLNLLIKQGKEALGSKVEVIDCDDDDNWDE